MIDELEELWKVTVAPAVLPDDPSAWDAILKDALDLLCNQGEIFVSSDLVFLEPAFATELLKPLVDHRLSRRSAEAAVEEHVRAARRVCERAPNLLARWARQPVGELLLEQQQVAQRARAERLGQRRAEGLVHEADAAAVAGASPATPATTSTIPHQCKSRAAATGAAATSTAAAAVSITTLSSRTPAIFSRALASTAASTPTITTSVAAFASVARFSAAAASTHLASAASRSASSAAARSSALRLALASRARSASSSVTRA